MAGWVADADRGSLYALDSQLCDEPLKLAVSTFPRADVSTHLRSSSEPVVSDRHGFVSVATSVLGDAIYICRHDDAQVRLSPVFNLTRQELSKSDFFGRLRQHAIEIGDNTTAALTAFLQEIKLEKFSKRAEVSRVVEFGPRRTDTCDVSIIVPFFGDSFYLLDHIAAQSRAPNSVEWIFVCDDPRLVGTLIETLRCRSDALMQRTKLVILAANFGFAEANNAAIGFADGKYLLLMNSDVYCEKFDFLNYAIGEFEQHQTVGCIGFSLQFEDGTIQHDGMTFERAIWMDGLWVCEHKNKGMPQNWEIPVCESADAVTAALMLLRRSDLTGEELFDRSYVVGDFEDADLCMRLRERGKSIRIVRTSGLFHLERQSLRLVGDASSRNSLTHVNCITFNRRWAGQLAENWI
jgi:GT2 family glycosyltransferase